MVLCIKYNIGCSIRQEIVTARYYIMYYIMVTDQNITQKIK